MRDASLRTGDIGLGLGYEVGHDRLARPIEVVLKAIAALGG